MVEVTGNLHFQSKNAKELLMTGGNTISEFCSQKTGSYPDSISCVPTPSSPITESSEKFEDERYLNVNESNPFNITNADVQIRDGALLTEHFDWESLIARLEVRYTTFISNVNTALRATFLTDHLDLWYDFVAFPSILFRRSSGF